MRGVVRAGCVVAVGLGGCTAVPPLENPVLVKPAGADCENPVLVAPENPTPAGYADVYERTLDALDDYFEVVPGSRFAGQIETVPRVAAGYEQPWKPGTPDRRERLLATLQTVRHYAKVQIWAAERGGYRVYVEVYKEIEDIPRPTNTPPGGASFRETPTVDRRVEVLGVVAPGGLSWIPAGRDPAFEQAILRKIQKAMAR